MSQLTLLATRSGDDCCDSRSVLILPNGRHDPRTHDNRCVRRDLRDLRDLRDHDGRHSQTRNSECTREGLGRGRSRVIGDHRAGPLGQRFRCQRKERLRQLPLTTCASLLYPLQEMDCEARPIGRLIEGMAKAMPKMPRALERPWYGTT